jgi:hypothetical protein
MFYRKDDVNEATTCGMCFEIYEDPRNLPCGESACHDCIVNSIENNPSKQFECSFCDKIHKPAKKQGFPKNRDSAKLIMIKAEEEKRTKNIEDWKAKMSEMKNKRDEFKINLNTENGIDQIQDQCTKLRNQVHLRTEVLIEQLHQINERMVAEIGDNEKRCIQTFNGNIGGELRKESGILITEIDDFYDKNSKYVTQFKINKNVVRNSLAKSVVFKRRLNKQCDKLQKIKFNKRITQFTNSSFELDEKLVGSLCNKYFIFDEFYFNEFYDYYFIFAHDDFGQKAYFYIDDENNLNIELLDSKAKLVKRFKNILKGSSFCAIQLSESYLVIADDCKSSVRFGIWPSDY